MSIIVSRIYHYIIIYILTQIEEMHISYWRNSRRHLR